MFVILNPSPCVTLTLSEAKGKGLAFLPQGKLREGSHEFLRFAQDMLPCLPAGRG